MSTIDLNAFLELKDEALQERIQAIYEGLPHKTITEPLDETIKSDLLKTLKEQGIEPGTKDRTGAELTHYAAQAGHIPLLKLLISIGFNPEATYSESNLGLFHCAIKKAPVDTIDRLIEMNFDLNILDKNSLGLLHYAVLYNQIEKLHCLISKGLKLDKYDMRFLNLAAQKNHIKMFQTLLEMGHKIDLSGVKKKTLSTLYEVFFKPLEVNTPAGKAEALNILAKAGIHIETKCENGLTFLHYAAAHGQVELFKALVAIGFDKNAVDASGMNALIVAAVCGQVEMVRTLVSMELKISLNQLAKVMDFNNALSTLYDALLKPIDISTPDGKFEALNILINIGITEDSKCQNGYTLLHHLIIGGQIEILKYLINLGFDKDILSNNKWGLLHFAVLWNQIKILEYLISIGLNKNVIGNRGLGLLHYAAMKSETSVETLKYLISIGLDPNATSPTIEEPLHLAVRDAHIAKVKALIALGANKDALAYSYGVNNLWFAAVSGDRELLELLIKEYGVNLPDLDNDERSESYSVSCHLLAKRITDKNKDTIELYKNATQLRILYFSYLSSFVQKELDARIPVKEIIAIISAYLPSEDREDYRALKQNVLSAIELRKMLLSPLIIFCKQNPINEEARTALNDLLDSKKLGAEALENELDTLLNKLLKLKIAPDFVPKLVECRRKTEEITGNELTLANDNLAVLQGTLDYEKQKTNNEKLKTLALKNQLQSLAAFQFKCLCFFATINTATLALGLLALCVLNPVAMGIAMTSVCMGIAMTSVCIMSLAGIFYSLNNSDPVIKEQPSPSLAIAPLENIEIAHHKPEQANNSLLSLQDTLKNQKQELLLEQQKQIALKNQLQVSNAFQCKFLYACLTLSPAILILGVFTIAAFTPITATISITLSVASLLATSYGLYCNSQASQAMLHSNNRLYEPLFGVQHY